MNFDEIIHKVLEIADFPEDKRREFVSIFYEYFFTRLLTEVREIDGASADKILASSQKDTDPEAFKKVLDEISSNSNIKEKIEQVSDEVLGRLADDVAAYATDEQKQEILAVLPVSI